MRNFHIQQLLIIAIICLCLTRCGGGSEGTGIYTSDIAGDRLLSVLTQQEKDRICNSVKARVQQALTKDNACTAASLVNVIEENPLDIPGGPPIACELIKEECIKNLPPGLTDINDNTSCFKEGNEAIGCDVTVKTLDQCIQDYVESVLVPFELLSCADATNPSLVKGVLAAFEDPRVPSSPACIELQTKCGKNIFD